MKRLDYWARLTSGRAVVLVSLAFTIWEINEVRWDWLATIAAFSFGYTFVQIAIYGTTDPKEETDEDEHRS